MVNLTIQGSPKRTRRTTVGRLPVAVRARYTRIPKVHDLIMAGVPTEVIATYAALADHANNRTGICWPRMETLARRLSRSPRTIQRHLHLLEDLGLVEFVERLRDGRGRFGAYVYRLVHIAMVAARGGPRRPDGSGAERGGRKNHAPPDTGVLWPLLRGKLNVRKSPPTPPERTPRAATGGSSANRPPPGSRKSTTDGSPRGARGRRAAG